MDKETAIETTTQTIASEQSVASTETLEDAEARIAALEAERAKYAEESANYKMAYLKAKGKQVDNFADEDEDARIARIVQEKLSETKLAQIDAEKDTMLKRLARENKELKLAQLNKTSSTPTSVGSHSEGKTVTDTLITPEQMKILREKKGWDDKKIEDYKKLLIKSGLAR